MYLRCLDISSLNDFDRACLIAKYNSLYVRESIDPKLFEKRTEAEIKYLRKTLGDLKQISCNIEFNIDFKEYPDYAHFNFVMMAWYSYDKGGLLPFSGSLSEQPAQIMEIFELIMELQTEREAVQREQEKKEQEKRGRR